MLHGSAISKQHPPETTSQTLQTLQLAFDDANRS